MSSIFADLGEQDILKNYLSIIIIMIFLAKPILTHSLCFRFVNVPIDTVNKRLTHESGEATAEITSLEKKLQYHETTNQKSRENLEQILKSGGRA